MNETIRFTMDHMLIRLGKYLRIAGFDADWCPEVRTHELILRANEQGRVFVTRNRHIEQEYPQPIRMLRLHSDDPAFQFKDVVEQMGLDPNARLFSRCIQCNVALETVPDKVSIRACVEPGVFESQDRFWRCPVCGTVFWHGSHVRNTCRKLGLPLPTPS